MGKGAGLHDFLRHSFMWWLRKWFYVGVLPYGFYNICWEIQGFLWVCKLRLLPQRILYKHVSFLQANIFIFPLLPNCVPSQNIRWNKKQKDSSAHHTAPYSPAGRSKVIITDFFAFWVIHSCFLIKGCRQFYSFILSNSKTSTNTSIQQDQNWPLFLSEFQSFLPEISSDLITRSVSQFRKYNESSIFFNSD